MRNGDLAVQELSSFQLEIWDQSPPVAAVLNITPNHLDRHKTMAVYEAAKANIVRYQSADDIAVLCADDPRARALQHQTPGRVRLFSLRERVADGAYFADGRVWLRRVGGTAEAICDEGLIRLRGRHNLLNVLAAVTLADSVGIEKSAMRRAIATFSGVEHRLETIADVAGVLYVNDSIATAPERALAAIRSFSEPLILLAGGRDKDLDWREWVQEVNRTVKAVVLFGELGALLEALLKGDKEGREQVDACTIVRVESLEEALPVAAKLALPGDVVLLSPGGTSFDAYADFAARGEVFRGLVRLMSDSNESAAPAKITRS
jgi:UDP-N-acetylmuramoylalanine--D-glutamate ligase